MSQLNHNNHLAITENDKLQNRLYKKKKLLQLYITKTKSQSVLSFFMLFSGNFIFDLFYSNEILNSFIG